MVLAEGIGAPLGTCSSCISISDLIISFWLKFGSLHVGKVNNSVIPGEFMWKIEFSPKSADVSIKNWFCKKNPWWNFFFMLDIGLQPQKPQFCQRMILQLLRPGLCSVN